MKTKRELHFFILCALLGLMVESGLAQSSNKPGYPSHASNLDPWKGFVSPPKGYGEVPFFWWQGDTLTREKLTWQLDQLAGKHISSLQINYSHTDKGGLFWGLSLSSKPALFTEEWWNLFEWFMSEAKKRDMTVSLSDYTLGVGQGFAIDEVLREYPDMNAEELTHEKKIVESGNIKLTLKDIPFSIKAYPITQDSILQGNGVVDLTKYLQGKNLDWNAIGGKWAIVSIYSKVQPNTYNPMHPMAGKAYVKYFFQPFESRFPSLSKGGLDFFFSDELDFHLNGIVWDERFQKEFKKRKGYDIVPELGALFEDVGDRTPKVRMDYNDVFVSLSEENYFKPVYDWHEKRGLIYGCDHGGRGKRVDEFGDYFRTQRWNQGPGCDQPDLRKDIIKDKVASSISHLYDRQRVWLEGFYGSGWQTSSADLMDAIFANFVMGQNLLSLHGLYYATPGGWWEWAPPCNHYRMPYWKEMEPLLGCVERLSYLFSQGRHCADVAMLYPLEPAIAGCNNKSDSCTFDLGEKLYNQGIDFDFMDYESLQRASIKNKKLNVSGESFNVLIIPWMKAIKFSSLEKALSFKKSGGTVIFIGDLPEASEVNGRNDKNVNALVASLLTNAGNGKCIKLQKAEDAIKYINDNIVRDFELKDTSKIESKPPYILHRKIGKKDYYAMYNVDKGSKCFFRAHGGVELWDPWTGTRKAISVDNISSEGTTISAPLSDKEMQILVFDPNTKPVIKNAIDNIASNIIPIEGNWSFEIIPSLDNKYGDFYWPAKDEKVGALLNFLEYSDGSGWREEQLGYVSRLKVLEGISKPLSESELLQKAKNTDSWKDLTYSWRWGVKGDYGHQGYHGLKLEMYDDFIRLGELKYEGTGFVRLKNPKGDNCYVSSYVFAPADGIYEVLYGETKPKALYLNGIRQVDSTANVTLKKGANQVLMHYEAPCTTYLVFIDPAKKGQMVPGIEKEKPIAMKWNGDLSILSYDLSPVENTKANFFFNSAPGLSGIELWAYGDKLTANMNNQECTVRILEERIDGLKKYEIKIVNPIPQSAIVNIQIDGQKKGSSGTAAFPYPIKQICDKGEITIGDWTKIDGLRCYSGGAKYSKTINLETDLKGHSPVLDLGDVISTARLFVNGKEIGLRMTPPWNFELDGYLNPGDNLFEIVVYNTAGNHYKSIPTQYLKDVQAGILGPVRIIYR